MGATSFDYLNMAQEKGLTGSSLLLEILRMTKRNVDPSMSDEDFREFKVGCLIRADVTREQLAHRLVKDLEESQSIINVIALFSKTGNIELLKNYLTSHPMEKLIATAVAEGGKKLKNCQSAHGGKAKSDKLQPIRDYCRDLYQQQPAIKPHQTKLKAIRDRVIEYAKTHCGKPLSYDQFIKTASGWVADLRAAPAE